MPLEVFVSHSHKDKKLAEALVVFLTVGVGLDAKEIRGTSYIPAGLSSGARIEEQLR